MTREAAEPNLTMLQREEAVAARELLAAAVESSLRLRTDALDARADALGARTDLTTQNGELREANEKLVLVTLAAQELEEAAQVASRRQEEFLAMLSHELRNPLAPITTAVELLARLDGKPIPTSLIDILRRQVRHMVRLVDDLLDVSRVTHGKVVLQRRPTPMADILSQAVDACAPLIAARRQRLQLDMPNEAAFVHGDPVRLVQVFANLLQNAAKYTQEGGEIVIRMRALSESVEIGVRDNGMGIAAETLPRVFELFAQEERALGRVQGGLGIGLTIVRQMIQAHGGTVTAASAGTGLGSEFIVTLPRIDDPGHVDCERPVAAPASLAAHVLVVEDNKDAGDMLAELLRGTGLVVDLAIDGPGGLALFESGHPQVVLCDIGLPGMDGYEVVRRMRVSQHQPRPALIAVTGYGGPRNVERAVAAGFDHHVTKPVDPDVLMRLIDSLLPASAHARPH